MVSFSGRQNFVSFANVCFFNFFLCSFVTEIYSQKVLDCGSYNLQTGESVRIGRNTSYYGATACKWQLIAPNQTTMNICCNVNIPKSNRCQQDHLKISLTGNLSQSDGRLFCGKVQPNLTSVSNVLSIGFKSEKLSKGGRYNCSVSVVSSKLTITTPPNAKSDDCYCGWRQEGRIVGGRETGINEYPFMGGLLDIKGSFVYCGASIISIYYALTAAHCIYGKNPTNIGLLVGDHDITTIQETHATALHAINYALIHENYTNDNDDIAIMRVDVPIEFSMDVGPVCLSKQNAYFDYTGHTVIAMGWGLMEFAGQKADKLQSVDLDVISNNICKNYYSAITDSTICTYTKGKDTCQMDSGGPLVWFDANNTKRYHLIGIVSSGSGCASEIPTVNMRVPSYLAWISSNTIDFPPCFV